MQGKRRVSAIQAPSDRKAKLRKPSSKELDLFLLAGCSCLMTLLYHPVANALQSNPAQSSPSAIAAQTSTSTQNSMNTFHLTLQGRNEVREEEDA